MSVRNLVARRRDVFKKLPFDLQLLILRASGRPQAWDPKARLLPPPIGPGEVVGPPDFVGIGAQKCGTSWWFDILQAHPKVHRLDRDRKELHYFSDQWDTSRIQESAPYREWFPRPPGYSIGEWTPDYMALPWVAPLLAATAPMTKILVMLRDPIERWRSGVTHDDHRGRRAGFRPAMEATYRGRYAEQLAWWRNFFPREQMHVMQYEACVADPVLQFDRCLRFLGLDATGVPMDIATPRNRTSGEKLSMPSSQSEHLLAWYRDDVADLFRDYKELLPQLWHDYSGSH